MIINIENAIVIECKKTLQRYLVNKYTGYLLAEFRNKKWISSVGIIKIDFDIPMEELIEGKSNKFKLIG